jgi:acetylxylan esterase
MFQHPVHPADGVFRMKVKILLTGLIAALLTTTAALVVATPASAASLTEVTGFGTNPTNLRMHLYVPDRLAARPAILVAVHYCTGSGPAFYSGSGHEFATLADQYGYIVIFPSATRSGACFDVSSPGALRHDGNSDPVGIVSMVRYVQQRYATDPARVFVTGASSGAMMTNVLLGDYPDVFAAGAAFAGVPFACFATTDGSSWNSACANGQVTKTAQQWGDLARGAYPGYTGPRPRMQLWHGTNDDTLRYPNFGEEIKQWTNVLGVSQTPASTDSPQSGWTHTKYGNTSAMPPVEAYSLSGVGHSLPMSGMAAQAIRFFGLDGTPPPTSPPPTSPPPTGGSHDAYGTIQAESSNAQSGTQLEACADTGGGQDVGWIGNGDWLRFDGVNFGSNPARQFVARAASGAGGGVSGLVEVRLDSLGSAPIGSFAIANTGGWQSWRTVPANIAPVTGTHTVYVTFTSGQPADFVNVNWLTFGH